MVHNYESNWFYLNNATDNAPQFNLQTKALFQDTDVGGGSMPVFFDHNADGLLDLLIGVNSRFRYGFKQLHLWFSLLRKYRNSRASGVYLCHKRLCRNVTRTFAFNVYTTGLWRS